MLSGVTVEVGETQETFRLTTRAMMAVEDQLGRGLIDVVQSLEHDFRVGTVVRLIAECADDGRGVELARAQEIVDTLGLQRAGDVMSEIVEKAFPEASGKNRKGAGRKR